MTSIGASAKAGVGREAHPSGALIEREMAELWSTHLDNVWASTDAEPGVASLNLFNQTGYTPKKSFVRQLVALALAPASFLPTSAAAPRTTIFLKPQLDSLDPLKQAPSRLRLAALTALRSIATRHGARAVLRALPGYGIPGPLLARLEEVRPRLDSDLPRKKRRLDVDEADESPSDEDDESPVARAGRCVAKCEDCWDLLAGKAVAKRAKVEDGEEEDPVHGSEGWELLRALLDVWEEEGSRDLDGPTSLLSQFKPSSLGEHAPRIVSAKCLDVLMAPFGNQNEQAQPHTAHLAARLLGLIASLASADKIDGDGLLRSVSLRLNSLSPAGPANFFDSLSPCPPLFTIRLCAQYLSLHATATGTTSLNCSLLSTPSSSGAAASSVQPSRSPTRRLGPRTSLSSIASPTKPSDSDTSHCAADSHSAFAAPKLDDVLALLRRVPNELPRQKGADAGTNLTPAPSADGPTPRTLRRPAARTSSVSAARGAGKGEAGWPTVKAGDGWPAVERAAKVQRVVKGCLVGAVNAWLMGQDNKDGHRGWGALRAEGAKAVVEADEAVAAARAVAARS